ncbi:hypothetical protein GG804_14025 [Sphingomonas histidinilytica]|uniref:hypothetical protein n=1 Tax=Rhizorhabdus histidinilytica TaxID=439228 RepID=UPI001ADC4FE0|nr:hypothetical protein [Rhizorhabdus histidinilytica]MBO9377887.1 hypothetical protein [Rhizorhabdus histidinilytica]
MAKASEDERDENPSRPVMSGWMTPDQLQEVAAAVTAKSRPGDPCPNCSVGPSEVIPFTGRIAFDYHNDRPLQALPTVATVCSNCGFVRQFSARQLGLSFEIWSDDDRNTDG